jgi:hypothetical protein
MTAASRPLISKRIQCGADPIEKESEPGAQHRLRRDSDDYS